MTPQLHRTACYLALLGICLQAAVACLGGRLCFRTSAAPAASLACCFDACCDAQMPGEEHGWLEGLFEAGLAACPTGSECCIDQPATPIIHVSGGVEQLIAPAVIAWLSPDAIASAALVDTKAIARPCASPKSPPDLRPIATIIILI